MSRQFVLTLAAAGLFVPLVLALDGPGLFTQIGLGAATALFLAVMVRRTALPWRTVAWAIAIATTGEVVLSMGWHLYDYRIGMIPFYVPFGHGVFYTLALAASQQPFLERHAAALVRWTLAAGSGLAATQLFVVGDVWGLLWWIAAAFMIARSRHPLLMTACFLFTLVLEWLGTGMGNWRWAEIVPFVGLRSGNPPSGVGILYCVLDALTVAVSGKSAWGPIASS